MKQIIAAAVFVATATAAHAAWAGCSIHDDTKYDFKVESGNTSNQSVGPHTTTSIASGKIKAVDSKAGQTLTGQCKDGDKIEITEKDGKPVLSIK